MSSHCSLATAERELDRRGDEHDAEVDRLERIAALAEVLKIGTAVDADGLAQLIAEDVRGENIDSLTNRLAQFAIDYTDAGHNDSALAEAGFDLWRYLKPYMAAMRAELAESIAREQIDHEDQLSRDDADEAMAAA